MDLTDWWGIIERLGVEQLEPGSIDDHGATFSRSENAILAYVSVACPEPADIMDLT